MSALAGALIALAVVGGFLALDRTLLHIYTDEDATIQDVATPAVARITGSEAEIYAVRHFRAYIK